VRLRVLLNERAPLDGAEAAATGKTLRYRILHVPGLDRARSAP
jgi:hypothetical protein